MKLTIALTQHCRPISIAAILDVFQTVNSFYLTDKKEKFFEISIANDRGLPTFDGILPVPLSEISNPDLILIPAFTSGDLPGFLEANYNFIPWLQLQYAKGSEIGSFCTGAYLLAVAGLLNGKKATTHVIAANELRKHFPEILLEKDNVVTDDGGIYTSGGATSSFHLMLYLVEKFCGRAMAIKTSKYFAIDMDREYQTYFASFSPNKQHNDALIFEAQRRMESSFTLINTVDEIIKDLPVSRRNFIRRFKSATGTTPIEYLQNTRIERAKFLLENTNQSIFEVMLEVGYSDMKTFRLLFRRLVGLTPSTYREKFTGKTVLA